MMGTALRKSFMVGAMAGGITLASGCASLSLFSSRHTHHHGLEDEAKQELAELDQRVSALEQAQEKGE